MPDFVAVAAFLLASIATEITAWRRAIGSPIEHADAAFVGAAGDRALWTVRTILHNRRDPATRSMLLPLVPVTILAISMLVIGNMIGDRLHARHEIGYGVYLITGPLTYLAYKLWIGSLRGATRTTLDRVLAVNLSLRIAPLLLIPTVLPLVRNFGLAYVWAHGILGGLLAVAMIESIGSLAVGLMLLANASPPPRYAE